MLSVLAPVLVALIGLTDYLTGPEISFSIFYLIPISLTAWGIGTRSGLAVASASAVVWLVADILGHRYSHPAIPYWNATVRLGIFAIIAVVLSRQRDARQRILRLMRTRSEFTAMVSHELRTPLTSIREGISIVHDGTVGSLNEAQRDCLGAARRNVDRLSRLVNDVLSYQQLEAGRLALRCRPCDINVLAEETLEGFRLSAANRRLDLRGSLGRDLPMVECDHDRIRQVLANLLHNALKFTEKGGVEVITEHHGSGVRVSVRDDGIGISPEDQGRLFSAYTLLSDGSRQGVPSGTGLGLAIASAIVGEHGGEVGLRSTPGRGSTFYFTLPCRTRQGTPADRPSAGDGGVGRSRPSTGRRRDGDARPSSTVDDFPPKR